MKHKRLWSSFVTLAVSMTSLTLPSPAFAEEETGPAAEPAVQTDMEITGNSSLGEMLADKLTAEQAALNEQNGCGIYDVRLSDTQAYVQFDTTLDCTLLLMLYDDTGENLLTSAEAEVTTEQTEITFDVPDVPESCYLRACLIDTETLAPISAEYSSALYTQEMQEFLSKTTDDFDKELVLNLDDDKTNNFAVFGDQVILLDSSETVNTLISADEESKTYVIGNIDETAANLQQGDIFALGEDALGMIIAKVDSIEINDGTATVTGAEIEAEDVFSYLRLESTPKAMEITQEPTAPDEDTPVELISNEEADAFFAEVTKDAEKNDAEDSQYPQPKPPVERLPNVDLVDVSGTVTGFSMRVPISTFSLDGKTAAEAKQELGDSFKVKNDDGLSKPKTKIIADIVIKADFDFELYISTEWQYFKLEPTFTAGIDAGVEIKGGWSKRLTDKPIGVSFFKVLNLEIVPRFEIEGSAKGLIKGTIKYKPVICYDSQSAYQNDFTPAPKITVEFEVVGKIFVGFSFAPAADVLNDDTIALKLECKIGMEAKGTWTMPMFPVEEHDHSCLDGEGCIDGAINAVVSMNVKILVLESFVIEKTLAEASIPIANFYYSIARSQGGWGRCPYDLHEVTFYVLDQEEKPISEAEITATINGKKQSVVTDEEGKASLMMNAVEHSYRVTKEGYWEFNDWVVVRNASRSKNVYLSEGNGTGFSSSRYRNDGAKGDSEYWGEPDKNGIVTANGVKYYLKSNVAKVVSYTDEILSNTILYAKVNGLPVTSIDDYAFNGCINLTSITIPDSVTRIGRGAFWGCSLTSVTIPDSVTSIDGEAFQDCSDLISVTIGNSVTSIGYEAFRDCTSLTSVTIGNSVTSIGESAFQDCSDLISVTIGNSVTSIDYGAFYNCTGLTSVTIPDSVTSISNYVFGGCTSLTEIAVSQNNAYYTSSDGVLFDKELNRLIQYPVGNARNSYTIPDSVTSIGNGAFLKCTGLTSVTIPDSVTSIDNSAFEGCTGLTSITIPNSVTSIDSSAFEGCTGLTSITIPDSMTSIGSRAFQDCSDLISVTIGNSVTSIGSEAFRDCTSLTSVIIGNSVTSIGSGAFRDCTSLTSVTIGNSVTTIGIAAFRDCTSLTDVYYGGTEEQWSKISIPIDNDPMKNATIHYQSATPAAPKPRFAAAPAETEATATTTTTTAATTTTTVTTSVETETESAATTATTSRDETDLTALTPNSVYNIYALADRELGVTNGNLLWFAQAVSDENGAVVVNYTGEVFAVKAKYNLANAECTVPELAYDGTEKEIFPIVTANDKTLTEGEDYWVSGSYTGTDGGVYSILLEGTGDYFGEKTLTYIIDGKETATLTGDVDLNGAVTMADVVLLMRLVNEDSAVPVAYSWANADTDSDGMLTTADVITLLKVLSEP